MTDCLFCKIIAGDIKAAIVHQDDDFVAIKDINPQAPVHVLIMTREHIESVAGLTPEHADLLVEIVQMAQWIAAAEGVAESGYRLVANTGGDGGQTVSHLHVHLLGGRQMTWPPG